MSALGLVFVSFFERGTLWLTDYNEFLQQAQVTSFVGAFIWFGTG